jgi:cell division protease FtsH
LRVFNLVFLLVLVSILVFLGASWFKALNRSKISLSYFEKQIAGLDAEGREIVDDKGQPVGTNILEVHLGERTAHGLFKVPPPPEPTYDEQGKLIEPQEKVLNQQFVVNIPAPSSPGRDRLVSMFREKQIAFDESAGPQNWAGFYTLVMIALSIGLLLLLVGMFRRTQNQIMGGGFLSNFARSPAKRYEPMAKRVTFDDVAGLEGVKADLQEIVEFLREPERFQKLGGRVPKGVLLVGPPGTGKTLLARAVAGEANVPFFSVNGAEFIQMFVGVGASRVRDLFQTAKAQAPAIIFIDEIDAVGRQRGAGLGGGHDEREQTLNQILGEMDGFQVSDSVIVMAATNRPDILDPALLRPGRFDRHVTVSRPTQKGRWEILKVHVRDLPLADDVDLKEIASATAGMTGADLQNLANEAALWAARQNKTKVDMSDFDYARDKVLMGAKREEILTHQEKVRTAYHEAGHTLAAWMLPGAHPVHKVTIIPRGQSLGTTHMMPDEDRLNVSENELRDNLVVLLSGRAAEQLVFDELTVGAENDLEKATGLARRMVTNWGMSERLGPVSYKMTDEDPFLGREIHQNRQFSERTLRIIDDEVASLLRSSSQKAFEMLSAERSKLESLAKSLVENEELDRAAIRKLIGPSVHDDEENDAGADDTQANGRGRSTRESVISDAASKSGYRPSQG